MEHSGSFFDDHPVIIIFSGINTGKTSFLLEHKNYKNFELKEQDECIIDTGKKCICELINSYKQHIKNRQIILVATNYDCWLQNFEETFNTGQTKLFDTLQWINIINHCLKLSRFGPSLGYPHH